MSRESDDSKWQLLLIAGALSIIFVFLLVISVGVGCLVFADKMPGHVLSFWGKNHNPDIELKP